MILEDELVKIGQYNKSHGVKGEISATFFIDVDSIEDLSTLICLVDGIYVPFFVESVRPKNDSTLLLKLVGIEDEKSLKFLVNKDIFALKKEVSDEEQVYCDYFVGFEIYDVENHYIGEIVDVDDTTENALFIVEKEDDTFYIPITEDFITDIDEEKERLTMNLPEGMVSTQMN